MGNWKREVSERKDRDALVANLQEMWEAMEKIPRNHRTGQVVPFVISRAHLLQLCLYC